MSELRPSIGLLLAIWAAIVVPTVLCLLFLGAGYASLVVGSPLLLAVFFASSRSRWMTLQRWFWSGDDLESTWSPRIVVLLTVFNLLSVVSTVVLFAGGNPAVF